MLRRTTMSVAPASTLDCLILATALAQSILPLLLVLGPRALVALGVSVALLVLAAHPTSTAWWVLTELQILLCQRISRQPAALASALMPRKRTLRRPMLRRTLLMSRAPALLRQRRLPGLARLLTWALQPFRRVLLAPPVFRTAALLRTLARPARPPILVLLAPPTHGGTSRAHLPPGPVVDGSITQLYLCSEPQAASSRHSSGTPRCPG